MKEFLFGWINKPYYMITYIESLIAFIELLIIFIVLYGIYIWIKDFIDKRRRKNAKNKR